MTSTGKKVLFGVLAAIGGLALLVVVGVVAFVVWVTQPGELIQPARLLSPDATGYAEWTLRREDPGTEGFLRLLNEAAQDVSSDFEPGIPGISGAWSGDADAFSFLPAVLAWTLHPPREASGEDLHLVSMSARALGNQIVLADLIAGFALARSRDPNVSVHEHQGETIYRVRPPNRDLDLALFARRGAVFLTSHLDTARQAVDLLARDATQESGGATRSPTALERRFAATSDSNALRAAVDNGSGELARVWEIVSGQTVPPGAWSRIEGASLTGGLSADGSFAGTLRLQVPDGGTAQALASRVPSAVSISHARVDLQVELLAAAADGGVSIAIRIPDAADALAAAMRGGSDDGRPQAEF